MKKLFTLFLLALLYSITFAQQVVLVFTGCDSINNTYVQLSRIEITDVTQGWTETLIYPDTVAVLTMGTGIADYANNGVFSLSQNTPNPFNGNTNVELSLTETGPVSMEIMDVTGRIVETMRATYLQSGVHQFHISITDAGIYFLTARQNGMTSSVKMVNNGGGAANDIEYVGAVETLYTPVETLYTPVETLYTTSLQIQQKSGTRGIINHVFEYGDLMTYQPFIIVNGEEIAGTVVEQILEQSENITLPIDYSSVLEPTDGDPCDGTPTVTDVNGHIYNTVKIGYQCWTRENLRTTSYYDGTSIDNGVITSYDEGLWYYPGGSEIYEVNYGLLYNWKAVMHGETPSEGHENVQGICPTGWHVPSDAEWTQLLDYVGSQTQYLCNDDVNNIAKALSDTITWPSSSGTCDVGNIPSENNATGFSAISSGAYNGNYFNFNSVAYFWSSTEDIDERAYSYSLYYNRATVNRYNNFKSVAFSVRCIRD